jgi:hypothetical protein
MSTTLPPITRWIAAASLFAAFNLACARTPRLTEYDEQSNEQARSAPFVVVGVIDSVSRIGGPVASRHDPNYPMQLHRISVRVENVLRGSINERTITVYFFGFAGGFDGPRPLGFALGVSRLVLWLRRDEGVFRMACDGWDSCTMVVHSGAHPQYHADSGRSLDYALVDILLTRGEGAVDDLKFAGDIERGVPDHGIQDHVIAKLKQLATTESADIRESACNYLWIYTQDRIIDDLHQQANDALQSARCVCGTKPDCK